MKRQCKGLCLLLTVICLFSICINPYAAEPGTAMETTETDADPSSLEQWPAGPELYAEAGILMDARTGTILFGKNADEPLYPASITKLMTALLVFENCSLSETVTFSYEATHSLEPDASHISVTEGEQLTVEQCLYALFLKSANEVANGLAEHVAGSMEAFADMMNERAAQLGCTNTHFVNANGLHDDDHYSTCHDMALIMQALIGNEDFIRISSADQYMIPPTNKQPETRYLSQSHKMLSESEYTYEGTITGKTGYTPEAENTLVTYAVRGDLALIAVSMKSNWHHYDDTIAMFDYGFDNFSAYDMTTLSGVPDGSSELLSSQGLFDASSSVLELENSWAVLPNGISPSSLDTQLTIAADASDGIVAQVAYVYEGACLGQGYLRLTELETQPSDPSGHETAAAPDSSQGAAASKRAFTVALYVLGAVAVLFLLLLLVFFLIRRHRRKKRSSIRIRNAKNSLRHRSRHF